MDYNSFTRFLTHNDKLYAISSNIKSNSMGLFEISEQNQKITTTNLCTSKLTYWFSGSINVTTEPHDELIGIQTRDGVIFFQPTESKINDTLKFNKSALTSEVGYAANT